MSFPSGGHAVLTGKICLRNRHYENRDRTRIFYDGIVECCRTMIRHQIVRGVFQHDIEVEQLPLPEGTYNASSTVN